MFSLDFIGTLFGILSTIAFVFAWVIAWPLSLVAIVIDFILYSRLQIPGDALLQLGYGCLFTYGWIAWLRGVNNEPKYQMAWLTTMQRLVLAAILIVLTPPLAIALSYLGHSTNPVLDASTTLLSILAQALMCRKKIDSWFVWIIADIIYIKLYFIKGISWHAIILPIYIGCALVGIQKWRRLLPVSATTGNTTRLVIAPIVAEG